MRQLTPGGVERRFGCQVSGGGRMFVVHSAGRTWPGTVPLSCIHRVPVLCLFPSIFLKNCLEEVHISGVGGD